MKRKGSGAVILVIIVVFGALYYLGQNPDILEGLDGIDVEMPAGDGGSGNACDAALDELRPVKADYTSLRCTCSEEISFQGGSGWIALVEATGSGESVKSITLLDSNFNVQDMRPYMRNGQYVMSEDIRDAQPVSKCSLT